MVVEVAWVNGLAAIRSLGRHGLRVLAVDHRPYALGLRSRYAEARLAPDPLDDEAGFIEALPSSIPAALGLTLAFPLLLATLGFYLPAERKRLRRLLPAAH